VYRPKEVEELKPFQLMGGRDLRSVVDATTAGYTCPLPHKVDSKVPKVVQLQPTTYRISVLLPLGKDSVRFVVPSIFSSTGWVRQQLTGVEMCKVWDLPTDVAGDLDSKEISLVCSGKGFPQKIAARVLDSVRVGGPTEGNRKRPHSPSCSSGEKKFKEDGDVISHEKVTETSNDLETERKLKAKKSDDAAVPEYLWNLVLAPDGDEEIIRRLDVLRRFILKWLKRRFTNEFLGWFKTKYPRLLRSLCPTKDYFSWRGRLRDYLSKSREATLDWEAGSECVMRYANADWWEWVDGSRPHFWRWPSEYQKPVRDGVTPWLKDNLPRWLVPQRAEREESTCEAMKRKLDKVRRLRYLGPGKVESLTSFFSVAKGKNDIRMV
jgi:hypothetical protein